MSGKTLTNTTANDASINVNDIIIWGNGDAWKLISKASSASEGWMKSTKAMQVDGIGCLVQVTTQQGNNVAEALTYFPCVKIENIIDENGDIVGRKLVNMFPVA